MNLFLLACRFFGSWLLVAGPIYQAALELRDQGLAMDHVRGAFHEVRQSNKVSHWWWLVPPVRVLLEFAHRSQVQRQVMELLPAEEMEGMLVFSNKATGWLFVAGGGFLLAVSETRELTDSLHWGNVAFGVLCVMLALMSCFNTGYRLHRTEALLKHKGLKKKRAVTEEEAT